MRTGPILVVVLLVVSGLARAAAGLLQGSEAVVAELLEEGELRLDRSRDPAHCIDHRGRPLGHGLVEIGIGQHDTTCTEQGVRLVSCRPTVCGPSVTQIVRLHAS